MTIFTVVVSMPMRRSKPVRVMPQPAEPTAVSHVDLPLLRTRGQARTSRYVWTNPLHRSASADGGQKDTACTKQGVLAHAASPWHRGSSA
jgi:hypothetical protein